MLKFFVFRNVDAKKLRKVVLEVAYIHEGQLICLDRRRMFGLLPTPIFEWRLKRKKERMLKMAQIFLDNSDFVGKLK